MSPLRALNALDEDAFVDLLGGIFEHSPWVARRAYGSRPFVSRAALHAAMVDAVRRATRAEQLALLNAHPDLAGSQARSGAMTPSSTAEQASAGLEALPAALSVRMTALNRAYRSKFGFPFIIAVRDYDRTGILAELERRLQLDHETELGHALNQVYRIAALRLERAMRDSAE